MSTKSNNVANVQENVTNASVANEIATNSVIANVNGAGAPRTLQFVPEQEYIFSMRSFRMRNGFAFASVTIKDVKTEILLGQSSDYKFGDLLQAKQFGGSLYATFKRMEAVNGVEYPRFWDVSIG